ncbi:MAG: Crp/Fnr family transcriptional regulator [Anaerolineales bacterium]|nr:Crp/Fnr family transcriptional regulator [Anaerolineales bacterium]
MTALPSALSLLGGLPLLAGLPERDLALLAENTRAYHFAREAVIFYQGTPCDRVWLLQAGEVKIVHRELDGREVILEVISTGEVFGGTVLFMETHPAAAVAFTPVEALSFSREAYTRLLDNHPVLARRLIRMLGGRLHSLMGLQILAGERVERRLAHILVKLADRVGRAEPDGRLLTIPLSRQDLADMAGTTLETAIRTLSRFSAQGWLETRRGGYLLLRDLPALRQQAQPG